MPAVPNPCVGFDAYRDRYQHIRMERRDGILQMTFHKDGGPFRMCALAHAECADAFYQVSADHENRIVILTGTGDAFSTHWDRDFEHGSGEALAKIHWEGRKILENMLNIEALMISAINGPSFVHCFPVACDIVLAAENTVFQDQHIKDIGVVVGDGANIVWQYLLGPTRGKYFLLTGELLSVEEAKRLGVVNEILPRDKLLPRAWELAQDLARRPYTALRYSRLVLNQQWRRLMQDDMALSYGMQQLGAATTKDANFGRKVTSL
jgi:enoyl-CoA hydratase/carnithine racemase